MMRRSHRWSVCLTLWVVLAGASRSARADEIWVAPTYQQDVGGLGIGSNGLWPATARGAVRFVFAVPNDLQTFQGAKVVLIPHSPGGAASVNVIICPAQNGNPVVGGCAGPFAQAFTGVPNQLTEVDISAIVAPRIGTPGLNYVAAVVFTTPTTNTDHFVGMRVSFTETPPTGVATLGANTFSGTQTAPAFVGDGSALTNLPFPAGAATLGANTFSGTQTAPAFVGNGAGLTNLPFPAGAATTGANTFTGTQTINSGNLDLDPSTATVGNVTKNGVRFLSNPLQNTFLGEGAGNWQTGSGVVENNVAVGFHALQSMTLANNNTAVGWRAMETMTSGANNAAFGSFALGALGDGMENTALGEGALPNLASGNRNVAIGEGAGFPLTNGSNNIYVSNFGTGTAIESDTIRIGNGQTRAHMAGIWGVTPINVGQARPVIVEPNGQLGTTNNLATLGANTFTGTQTAPAFVGNGSGVTNVNAAQLGGLAAAAFAPVSHGHDVSQITNAARLSGGNTFTGTQTIDAGNLDLDTSTATTGSLTKNGARFLHNFGNNNVFMGLNSGNVTLTGGSNVGVGGGALAGTTTGTANTGVGFASLVGNSAGSNNTAAGWEALGNNGTGNGNTAMGQSALLNVTSGSFNTAVGSGAGVGNSTGSNNIHLGSGVVSAGPESNAMYLGKVGTQTKTVVAGVFAATVGSDALPVVIDSTGRMGTAMTAAPSANGVAALLNELQRQQQRIDALEQQVNELLALQAGQSGRQ